jgi:hypothetical protein
MRIDKYIKESRKLPEEIRVKMEKVFLETYKERKKVVGKNAIYSAKAAALSEAFKNLSRKIADRSDTNNA